MSDLHAPSGFIMVAPNGGRKTKDDHLGVPITVEETVDCARACYEAGAQALHAHVRDEAARHVLDAGLYRELLGEMAVKVPQMQVQITTEALGLYSAEDQRSLVRAVEPAAVSMALREQDPTADMAAARAFYHWAAEADVEVQHILYAPEDLSQLLHLQDQGVLPKGEMRVLFVLGRYADSLPSSPESLTPFLDRVDRPLRWMVCAFGQPETACLLAAQARGGEMRIGFENNELHADGRRAASNAERVAALRAALAQTVAAGA